jgi:hypothetical protein
VSSLCCVKCYRLGAFFDFIVFLCPKISVAGLSLLLQLFKFSFYF